MKSYQEGSSLSGYYAKDTVVVGDDVQNYIENNGNDIRDQKLQEFVKNNKVNFTFGCTQRFEN